MKDHQITIRKVDSLLHQRITRNAKLQSQSINDWVLDAIRTKAGISSNKDTQPTASWASHIGKFNDDSFDEEVLEDFEKIDESMWQS